MKKFFFIITFIIVALQCACDSKEIQNIQSTQNPNVSVESSSNSFINVICNFYLPSSYKLNEMEDTFGVRSMSICTDKSGSESSYSMWLEPTEDSAGVISIFTVPQAVESIDLKEITYSLDDIVEMYQEKSEIITYENRIINGNSAVFIEHQTFSIPELEIPSTLYKSQVISNEKKDDTYFCVHIDLMADKFTDEQIEEIFGSVSIDLNESN